MDARPGELHEPFPSSVPRTFAAAAGAAGVPLALAVTVVVEHELVLAELGNPETVEEHLDQRANDAVIDSPTGAVAAGYIRELVALLQGRRADLARGAPVVVPVRLANRLRAMDYKPALQPEAVIPALRWELASVFRGQTMTEWALLELLRRRR